MWLFQFCWYINIPFILRCKTVLIDLGPKPFCFKVCKKLVGLQKIRAILYNSVKEAWSCQSSCKKIWWRDINNLLICELFHVFAGWEDVGERERIFVWKQSEIEPYSASIMVLYIDRYEKITAIEKLKKVGRIEKQL